MGRLVRGRPPNYDSTPMRRTTMMVPTDLRKWCEENDVNMSELLRKAIADQKASQDRHKLINEAHEFEELARERRERAARLEAREREEMLRREEEQRAEVELVEVASEFWGADPILTKSRRELSEYVGILCRPYTVLSGRDPTKVLDRVLAMKPGAGATA